VTLTAPAIRLIGRHRRVFKFVYLLKRIYLLTYLLTYIRYQISLVHLTQNQSQNQVSPAPNHLRNQNTHTHSETQSS